MQSADWLPLCVWHLVFQIWKIKIKLNQIGCNITLARRAANVALLVCVPSGIIYTSSHILATLIIIVIFCLVCYDTVWFCVVILGNIFKLICMLNISRSVSKDQLLVHFISYTDHLIQQLVPNRLTAIPNFQTYHHDGLSAKGVTDQLLDPPPDLMSKY